MNIKKYTGLGIVVLFLALGVMVFIGKDPLQTSDKNKVVSMKKSDNDSVSRILTNKKVPYLEFSQEEYQKAVSAGKIIYLEFYANWCPICRAQEPELISGLDALNRDDLVAFRVNFKDDQTDAYEQALAQTYKVPYQHHKIVLKDNVVIIDSAENWDAQMVTEELSKL